MPMKKQFLKSKPECKVTFRLLPEQADGAQTAHLVGEFNDWKLGATPMKRLKNGEFTVIVNLDSGRDYQFRYMLDGERWENDTEADRYEFSPFGNCDNSVVSV